eukprot:14733597-Alexandrium_andersonii.AAC.1
MAGLSQRAQERVKRGLASENEMEGLVLHRSAETADPRGAPGGRRCPSVGVQSSGHRGAA